MTAQPNDPQGLSKRAATEVEDQALETALRSLAEPVLADDGFTARVLARVEAHRAERIVMPEMALARLNQHRARARHQLRYSVAGGVMGLVVAWAALQTAPAVDSAELLAIGLWPLAGVLCCGVVLAWAMLARRDI